MLRPHPSAFLPSSFQIEKKNDEKIKIYIQYYEFIYKISN